MNMIIFGCGIIEGQAQGLRRCCALQVDELQKVHGKQVTIPTKSGGSLAPSMSIITRRMVSPNQNPPKAVTVTAKRNERAQRRSRHRPGDDHWEPHGAFLHQLSRLSAFIHFSDREIDGFHPPIALVPAQRRSSIPSFCSKSTAPFIRGFSSMLSAADGVAKEGGVNVRPCEVPIFDC